MKRLFYSILIAISLLLYNACEKKHSGKDKIYLFIPDAATGVENVTKIPFSVFKSKHRTINGNWIDITKIKKLQDYRLFTITPHQAIPLNNLSPTAGCNAHLYLIPDTADDNNEITQPRFAITTYK